MGPGSGWIDRSLRFGPLALALTAGVALALRSSEAPVVLGRYSLAYACWIASCLALALPAGLFALRVSEPRVALARLLREPRLLPAAALLALPVVALAWSWLDSRINEDLIRLGVVGACCAALLLEALRAAAADAGRALRRFATRTTLALVAVYALAFGFTPLLGGWMERTLGKSGATGFDRVSYREVRAAREEIERPGAVFGYSGTAGLLREFEVEVRNNSWGFHDRERSAENPEGRTRILLLGDGLVRALGVSHEQGIAAVLEGLLNAQRDAFEVIPLASRTGQAGQLARLEEWGPVLAPQGVVVVWEPNDLLAASEALAAREVPPLTSLLFPGLALDRYLANVLHRRLYLVSDAYRLGTLRPDHWAYLEPDTPEVAERAEERERRRLVEAAFA